MILVADLIEPDVAIEPSMDQLYCGREFDCTTQNEVQSTIIDDLRLFANLLRKVSGNRLFDAQLQAPHRSIIVELAKAILTSPDSVQPRE